MQHLIFKESYLFNTSSPDKALFYAFCALLVWLPLPVASNLPWAWSVMEVWTGFLFISWCWLYFQDKVRISKSCYAARYVLVFFGLWLIYITLQITPLSVEVINTLSPLSLEHWLSLNGLRETENSGYSISVDQKITRLSLLLSLSYFLIFFLTLVLVTNRKRLKFLAYSLVCSGLFQAVYGAVMTLSGMEYGFFIKKYAYVGVATGTFVNRNHLAGYLEMTLAIGIGLLIATIAIGSGARTWKKKLLNLFRLLLSAKARLRLCLVMMVIALVLTHSRMGNTAFFISLFITGAIGLVFSRHATRSVVILLVSLVIIDMLIVGQWFGFEKLKHRLEQTSEMSENRDEVYGYAIEQWREYPQTGSGLGSFYAVFPQYRGVDVYGYNREAHNDYLQFATETGVIGLVLLALITLISFFAAIFAHHRRRDPLMRGISFASIMGILAIMIHSTVDFNLQIPANAATFVVLLAFAWISLCLAKKKKEISSIENS